MQVRAVAGKWLLAAMMLLVALPVAGQITTGLVGGTIKDAQGGVIPGATVVLISESRGTKSVPAVTNAQGDWTFPNTTADTYTVEVTMPGFKTLRRTGVRVSGGDRVAVGTLTIEIGGATETVDVTAEAPLIQATSGERSFSVSSEQIQNLPVGRTNFANLVAFVPGVQGTTTRVGGGGQNNIMMDGISTMDTGNNGQMLQMNIESIAEVKVLTQGYQAEYGRSSGMQITAVTKSGTNRFHGSAYEVRTDSKWNTNSWVNQKNGDAKSRSKTDTLGYSLGGPIGKPGGDNKLFFFYSHEYRPVTAQTNGGSKIRLRVPTAAERAGDFSQSLDQNGAFIGSLKDPNGGTFAGNVIPQNRLYQMGINILSRYPLPNITQAAGTNYNYEVDPSTTKNLTQQPALRVDYQFSPSLRVTGKYSGQRARRLITPGTLAGFNDVQNPYPFITNYGLTANYTLNPTTFVEATYGFIRNQLAGGGSGGLLINDAANRLDPSQGLGGLPLIYPNAGVVDTRYYAYKVMNDRNPVWWDGKAINLPPSFSWGSKIGAAPPNQQFPGFLNINRTQDIAISLTKIAGRHTLKAGFYNNHSFKAQNANPTPNFQGTLSFANDTTNALDTGFGYANAAVGVFTQYQQAEKLVEGNMVYNNTEFYLQDNWKVNTKLTLDYGMRFTRQQPQYDLFEQMSTFFPEKWSAANAPLLYVPGCSTGAATCSGNTLNAMNPVTRQILTATGAVNTQAAIGTVIPGTGSATNGIIKAGDGIASSSYVWPTLVAAPRFGAAYDVTGTQSLVIRGGAGLFFDRPDGNTVFSIPGNPPISTSQDLRNGNLQTLGTGLNPVGVPAMNTFEYNSKIPTSVQWQGGVQMALPWSSSIDVSYVGQHAYNRLGNVNVNAVDIGTAYLAEKQDTTKSATVVPGNNAFSTNLLRPYRGLSTIGTQLAAFQETSHSIQSSFNRRFRNGVQFGVNYTLGLSYTGTTGLTKRLQHDGTGVYTARADQADYEKLFEKQDLRKHLLKANFTYDAPDFQQTSGAMRVAGIVLNDWQLSGVFTAGSNGWYDLGYSYNANGQNVNITGSPDFAGRIVYLKDITSGCSGNQYQQFDVTAVTGPGYNSVGLESGRNVLQACNDKTLDLALSRNINLGGGRQIQLRLDAFNVLNTVVINGRSTTIQYNSPTDLTVRNSQTLADGTVDPAKSTPRNAGFGAATSAQGMRNLQAQVRFQF